MLPSMENNPGSSLDHIHLPPGFRFHPSDEELIVHYLMKKITSSPLPASIITEIDLYKYNPWELDDWMHCRLRKKIGFPGKVSSNEINGHLPGLIQFWPSNLNTHVEVTKSNLYNDCPMLPYIFSFPGTPYTETTSSLSLLSSLNSCMSVHQEDSEKQNMQIPDSLENFFNPLKRKLMEQNQGKSSIVLPSSKLVNGDAAMYCSDINNFRERDRH